MVGKPKEWRKAFESDLTYVVNEMKEGIQKPAVVIITGDMGAGKTTFCKHFSGDETIISPTYALITETRNILHADFYRLEKPSDIEHLELENSIEDKDYILIEWGKKHLQAIERIVGEGHHFYELKIEINKVDATIGPQQSRNYILKNLS
jgi:tRNA threonylcarbamoyladenosine biosynthesis protein TsaE